MTDLVKVKGLKGKQNKKKWNKNIDVSALLQARAQQHTQHLRQQQAPNIEITDTNANLRAPLDPQRFKKAILPSSKPKYDNRITRRTGLGEVDDPWSKQFEGKHRYAPPEVPAVIAPETGHSYNPRSEDIEKIKDRVIDFQQVLPVPRKQKTEAPLPEVEIRHRNKNKRAAQLAAKERERQKEYNRELTNIRKIKESIGQEEKKTEEGIKTKQIMKERIKMERATGRVRKGPKLSKKIYRFKQYLPDGQTAKQVSKVELNPETFRDRFDSIYRRGVFEPRNVKVHANRHKNIKVVERAFIQ